MTWRPTINVYFRHWAENKIKQYHRHITRFTGVNVRDRGVFTTNYKYVNSSFVHALPCQYVNLLIFFSITVLFLLTYLKSLMYKNKTSFVVVFFLNSLFYDFNMLHIHFRSQTAIVPTTFKMYTKALFT